MRITFTGKIWFWRGPAPFYFVTVPAEHSAEIKAISGMVTYGWGMVPVQARINDTEWKTAMFPKVGSYILPLKTSVRKTEQLDKDDDVTVLIEISSFDDSF